MPTSTWWIGDGGGLMAITFACDPTTFCAAFRCLATFHPPISHAVLYSIFLSILGFGSVLPSPETLAAIERSSLFITGVLQATIFYIAFRVARFPQMIAAAVALILLYVLWESYGQFLPLVETLMVPLAMLSVCQFARLAFDRPEDARNNLLLFGSTAVFSVVLGLTLAPTLLFWSIAAVPVYAVRELWAEVGDGLTG